MKINFVGNPNSGYVGEVSDETHLVRELRDLGHQVNFIPRDIWKASCDGLKDPNWDQYLTDLKSDISIICKWPHFDDSKYVDLLGIKSKAPVFYWVWDFMSDDPNENFNTEMAKASDVYLTNEGGSTAYYKFKAIPAYYFPYDCADSSIARYQTWDKEHDVVFFGNHFGKGDRVSWLKQVKDKIPLKIFSWNHEEWLKDGFDAYPAVYGEEFNKTVAKSKICLQFSVDDHNWGYWSNRTGKILLAGGFLLARYAPGMELFLRDGAEYFSSVDEMVEKIDHFLIADTEREQIAQRGREISERFSSKSRVRELVIFIERYLKGAFA